MLPSRTATFSAGRVDLYLRLPDWYRSTRAPLFKDGSLPFYRYVIREKGKVEIGVNSCGMCHTRVMPDGSALKGAQGNFPFDRAFAWDLGTAPSGGSGQSFFARASRAAVFRALDSSRRLSGDRQLGLGRFCRAPWAIPPGVLARHGTSPLLRQGPGPDRDSRTGATSTPPA